MLPTRRAARGFTLLELMTTITIVAVLLTIGVPSMRSMIQRNRVSAANNDLLASISYARTTAINRGQLVSLCPSSDGDSCTSGGQDFEPGWIVYTYPAGAASANKAYVAGTATLLRAVDQRNGVSMHALQTGVITFGLQGQLRPGTALAFLTCALNGSGTGASTTTVHGARMDVNGSGSVNTTALLPGASCDS